MGTHNTSNKLPTAHEMRLKAKKNQELQESRLADLPLYKECMFRLAESTGRYSRERIICGVPTNEFQDVRIERGTDASAIQTCWKRAAIIERAVIPLPLGMGWPWAIRYKAQRGYCVCDALEIFRI